MMKARLVIDIRGDGSKPGDIEYRAYSDGTPGGYAYRCPGCGQEDFLPIDNGAHGWIFDGDTASPSLQPSILHRPCGWHGYLQKGEFVLA